MGPIAALKLSLTKVFHLHTRAQRPEFWWTILFLFLITCSAVMTHIYIADRFTPSGTMGDFLSTGVVIFYAGVFGYFLSITIRRLHDTNRSAWNCLYLFLPAGLGLIVLPIMLSQKGIVGFNNYGPDAVQAEKLKAKRIYDEAEEFG